MFGLSAVVTLGLGLFILGLLIMAIQAIIKSRQVKPQEVDPVTGVAKLIQLIKDNGLGLVVAAAGLFIMLWGVVQPGGDGAKTPTPSPSSSSSATTRT